MSDIQRTKLAPDDACAHCGHPEVVHVNDGERPICQRCLVAVTLGIRKPGRLMPAHSYESLQELDRHVFKANRAVYALAPGSTFTLPTGRVVEVLPPCDVLDDGLWFCVTHMLQFPQNMDKDIHCYAAREITPHAMIWICWRHGAEHPGEQATSGTPLGA